MSMSIYAVVMSFISATPAGVVAGASLAIIWAGWNLFNQIEDTISDLKE